MFSTSDSIATGAPATRLGLGGSATRTAPSLGAGLGGPKPPTSWRISTASASATCRGRWMRSTAFSSLNTFTDPVTSPRRTSSGRCGKPDHDRLFPTRGTHPSCRVPSAKRRRPPPAPLRDPRPEHDGKTETRGPPSVCVRLTVSAICHRRSEPTSVAHGFRVSHSPPP